MRRPRLKLDPNFEMARYHAMSRAVNGEFYFRKTADKENFCALMWRVAAYCGLQILAFVVMSNHFHVEIHVPLIGSLTDGELLRRYELLHPKATHRNPASIDVIRAMLAKNGPDAVEWRRRQLRQMGDLSQFMKQLKQRHSIRYNRTNSRFGTMWAERFTSVLMEGRDQCSLLTALYIDLNPVRAGLVRDPKDYRFSSYGAAVGGDERARQGIKLLLQMDTWEEAQAAYRVMLFAAGAEPGEKGASIPHEDVERVLREGGTLPLATALRCRARYLTNTLVLGSQAFVEKQLAEYRKRTGARMKAGAIPLPGYTDWGGLFALRRPRTVT